MGAEKRERRISGYLPALDGVRVLSLMLIVMFHTWQQTWISYSLRLNATTNLFNFEIFQRYGYVAIDTFFVLSGFCLFYPVARDMFGERRFGGWRNYFVKRLRRIYPVYALMLLVLLLFPAMSWTTNNISDPRELARHFLSHLLFVHNFSEATIGSTISTAWTLAIEAQFYLLFPLICVPFRRRPAATFCGMALISVGLRLFMLSRFEMNKMVYQAIPFEYLDVFGFGMLSAYGVVWARNRVKGIHRLRLPMTLLSLACAGAGIGYIYWLRAMASRGLTGGDVCFRFLYRGLFAAVMALLIFSLCYSYDFWQRKVWGNRFFAFLSSISYAVYLWHQNIYILLKRLNIPYSTMDPVMSDRHAMDGLTLLCLSSSLLIGWLLTKCVEGPIVKYGYAGCARKIWGAVRNIRGHEKAKR